MFKNHFRWFVIFMLFLICVINYIDRASLSFAIPIIDQTFHFSNNQKGLLLGAFGIGYACSTFLGGLLADKFGAKITLAWSAVLWSMATFSFAFAHDFGLFIVSRVLLGLAEGPVFPCLAKAISDWLPEKERVRALSFSLISVPFSLAISGPIVSELIMFTSWRNCYYILATISVFWIPLWLFFFTNKSHQSRFLSNNEKEILAHAGKTNRQEKMHLLSIFKNKTLMANNFAYFSFGFYMFFFMTWLPSYLESEYHLSIRNTAYFTMLPWLFASIMMYISGQISDKLLIHTNNLRKSRTLPILAMLILQTLCIIPILIWNQNSTVALTFICLAIGFTMAPNGIYYSVNSDITKERCASSSGIMDLFFAISGFIAPSLTGLILNYMNNYNMVFYGLISINIMTIIIVYLFHNTYKNVQI
ncbi:MAG: Membrane protein regulates uhpT expression [Pseudomonadota bacterium]|nr:Membrane protein regulates uhpT expression [Pseudomonadota bacterium]